MHNTCTSAIKLPLHPDSATVKILDSQSRMCNWLYNHLLEKANTLREDFRNTQDADTGKILYTHRGLRNLVPQVKQDQPFLRAVHSSPLKNTALRLTDCIQTYQKSRKGKRKGKPTGWRPGFALGITNGFRCFTMSPIRDLK